MDLVLCPRATGEGKVYKQEIDMVRFILLEDFSVEIHLESSLKSAIHFQKEKQNVRVHFCSVKLKSQLRGEICLLSFSFCFVREKMK